MHPWQATCVTTVTVLLILCDCIVLLLCSGAGQFDMHAPIPPNMKTWSVPIGAKPMRLLGAGRGAMHFPRHSNACVNSVHVRVFELRTCTSLLGLPCNKAQLIIIPCTPSQLHCHRNHAAFRRATHIQITKPS